jgi:hypothetical protein
MCQPVICSNCKKELEKEQLKTKEAVVLDGRLYCKACSEEAVVLPDAPLVDMNENFDSTAVKMVETMDLDDLTLSETGKAAKRSSETNTATVDLDDLELDKDKEEV